MSADKGRDIPPGLGEKFEKLASVMARLRSPDGCPWDIDQTAQSLSRHILEEAYEAVEAIDEEDWPHLSEELGDLLLQIVFQSRIAEGEGRFDLGDVIDGITEKLVRRHPHIFSDTCARTAEQVSVNWDRIKRQEETGEETASVAVPRGLPAIMAAMKVQGQAARLGFDWESADGVLEKLLEETEELESARSSSPARIEDELGDILFTVINLARHLDVDPEGALRKTSVEFVRRFTMMEELAAREGKDFEPLPPDNKERLWEGAKAMEETRRKDEPDN